MDKDKDWLKNASPYAETSDDSICQGPKLCKDREFDTDKADCQDCLDDMQKAIEQANTPEAIKEANEWIKSDLY